MGALLSTTRGWISSTRTTPSRGFNLSQADRSSGNQAGRTNAKVLVLGAPGAGKSTILKQMRSALGDSYTPEEIESYRQIIFRNIVQGLRSVLDYMADLQLEVSEENEHLVWLLDDIPDLNAGEPFPVDCRHVLERLWFDPSVQTAYSRGNQLHGALPENLPYFFGHMDRLFEANYGPTQLDIIHAKDGTTTGITETSFKGTLTDLNMITIGRMVGERRKWIHCFDNVNAVLFVVALDGYDKVLLEDRNASLMEDAMIVWDSITRSQWFRRTSLILLLNKNDVFEQRVQQSHIRDFFPDYDGEARDAKAGREYFKKRFARIAQKNANVNDREVYIHVTSAITDLNHRVLFAAVEDILLKDSLHPNKLRCGL